MLSNGRPKVTGADLKERRQRAGLTLAAVGAFWPGGPIQRSSVAGVEALASVPPRRLARYVEALLGAQSASSLPVTAADATETDRLRTAFAGSPLAAALLDIARRVAVEDARAATQVVTALPRPPATARRGAPARPSSP